MFVTRKKNKKKQCKQDISIYHEQIKRLLSSVLMTLLIRNHNLEIEKGRYCKISRILRLCKTCNKIEDEEHFILECTINSKLRTDLFAILGILQYRLLIITLLSHCKV
jgi:hypothetical protein